MNAFNSRMWTTAELLTMWEVGRAYGRLELSDAIDVAVAAALERPYGFGGPALPVGTRRTAQRLYREHLGVGGRVA